MKILNKKILLCCCMFLSGLCLQAQDPRKWLQAAEAALEAKGNIEAAYVATTTTVGQAGDVQQKGVLRLWKEKFRLTSAELSVWYDGTTQWTYVPRSKEVSISTPTKEELSAFNPYIILADGATEYDVKLSESQSATVRLELTPRRKGSPLDKIVLQLNRQTHLPQEVELTSNGGGVKTVVRIGAYRKVKGEAVKQFRFNKADFPGVTEIDLR